MKDFSSYGYNITTDPGFLDEQNAMTPELRKKIEWYYNLSQQGNKSSIQVFIDAIEKHPGNPQLKNYLSVLYNKLGDPEKALEVNRWIIAEHPYYLFGKLNRANEYFINEEYHKMPEVLGEAMELGALYPDRDTFHIDEVIAFNRTAVLYFTAIGNIEQAALYCEIMEELAPDSPATEMAVQHLLAAQAELAMRRVSENDKARVSVKQKEQDLKDVISSLEFEHPEIGWLYTHGLYIGKDKLDTLLSLPRESLIRDLLLVLQDSVDRYKFFSELVVSESWIEENMNFVIHALFLLGELEASENLEAVFQVFGQSEEYLELFLGDFITVGIWEPLYKIAYHELEACKQFMMKPGIYTYVKSAIAEMVEQLCYHQPERRQEVLVWYKDILHFFLNSRPDDNVLDSDLIGLIICNLIDLQAIELKSDIEALFEKGLVSIGICGTWSSVQRAIYDQPNEYRKNAILSIADRYDEITSTWAGYNDDMDLISINDVENFNTPVQTATSEPRIGRNDPCPCGSGKKYKKCCLNRLNAYPQ